MAAPARASRAPGAHALNDEAAQLAHAREVAEGGGGLPAGCVTVRLSSLLTSWDLQGHEAKSGSNKL